MPRTAQPCPGDRAICAAGAIPASTFAVAVHAAEVAGEAAQRSRTAGSTMSA